MKHILLSLCVATTLGLSATAAQAACFADYKAKQDNPLRLEHGTIMVPDSACTVTAAQPIVAAQLAQRGWTLLNIVSVRSDN